MDISPISIFNIISNLSLSIGKFIIKCFKRLFSGLTKRRAERIIAKRLKVISSGFEDILAESKTCSLVSILRKMQNVSYSAIYDEKMKRAYLLKEWYDFLKDVIKKCDSRQIADCIREFSLILVRISNLAEETVKLMDQKMRMELKNDPYGWPLLKDLFHSTAKDVSNLTKEEEAMLIGVQEWSSVSIPDL